MLPIKFNSRISGRPKTTTRHDNGKHLCITKSKNKPGRLRFLTEFHNRKENGFAIGSFIRIVPNRPKEDTEILGTNEIHRRTFPSARNWRSQRPKTLLRKEREAL